MAKVQFQVDGLDANKQSIFNENVTFDLNVDANSISIGGVDISSIYATETYVTNAISNAAFDPSLAAGNGIDWNATTSAYDIDTTLIATQSYVTSALQTVQAMQGTQGIQGISGSNGIQGTTGIQGADGYVGSDGAQGVQGITGLQGATGTQGTQGLTGASGVSSSYFHYKADTNSQTNSQPASGCLRWNNTTQISSTELYINHLTTDSIDIDMFLDLLQVNDNIFIQDADNSDNLQQFKVSGDVNPGNNDYVQIPVTYVTATGTGLTGFSNNASLILVTTAVGIQGTTGAQGLVGPQGTIGAQGTVGTTGIQGASGTNGTQGTTGTQGLLGIQGTDGAQGLTGSQGTTGTQGIQGFGFMFAGDYSPLITYENQNIVAYQGSSYEANGTVTGILPTNAAYWTLVAAQGTQGITGRQGTTGTTGLQGTLGTQGIQGRSFENLSIVAGNARSIAAGSKTLSPFTNTGALAVGQRIRAAYTADVTQWMEGIITAIVKDSSITFTSDLFNGSGTYSDYTISVVGNPGIQGLTGIQGASGTTGIQGTIGIQGTTGTQGTDGTQGTQGLNGAYAAQGIAGIQGIIGATGSDPIVQSFMYR